MARATNHHQDALDRTQARLEPPHPSTAWMAPLFVLGESQELTLEELEVLYAATDWRPLSGALTGARPGKLSSFALMRALVLPYLIPIPSEAALARYLYERADLRALCGFVGETYPTRAMLWHFKHTFGFRFKEFLVHCLSTMARRAFELGIDVPFAKPLVELPTREALHVFSLDGSSVRISVHRWAGPNNTPAAGPPEGIELPAAIELVEPGHETITIGLSPPYWLNRKLNFALHGVDNLGGRLKSQSDGYNACNVLVVRGLDANRPEILLAERMRGAGRGQFTVPGGKQQPDETLEECARRELWEEARLTLLESHPVSLRWGLRVPGLHARHVWSVGVLATKFAGRAGRREQESLGDWRWYPLADLPSPLFEPARVAIEDFRSGVLNGLSWSHVDAALPPSNNERMHQIELPVAASPE